MHQLITDQSKKRFSINVAAENFICKFFDSSNEFRGHFNDGSLILTYLVIMN